MGHLISSLTKEGDNDLHFWQSEDWHFCHMYKIPGTSFLMTDFIFSRAEFYFYHTNLGMMSSIAPWLFIVGQLNSNSKVWLLCEELKKKGS